MLSLGKFETRTNGDEMIIYFWLNGIDKTPDKNQGWRDYGLG